MGKIKLILIGAVLGIILTFAVYLFLRPDYTSSTEQIDDLRNELSASQERERQSGIIITELTTTNNQLRADQQRLSKTIIELNDNQRKLAEELARGRDEIDGIINSQLSAGNSINESLSIVRELIEQSERP